MAKRLEEIRQLGLVFALNGRVYFVVAQHQNAADVVELNQVDWLSDEALAQGRVTILVMYPDQLVEPISDQNFRDLRPLGFYYDAGQRVKRNWQIAELRFFVKNPKEKMRLIAPVAAVPPRPASPYAAWG